MPLTAVVRIVKLAYCYEMWEVFDSMIDNTIAALKVRAVLTNLHPRKCELKVQPMKDI